MQLVPALPVAAVLLLFHPVRRSLKRPEFLFLAVLVLCSLGGVLILHPQLGMPRDWDMFAFVGPPLVILVTGMIGRAGHQLAYYRQLIILIIALNSLSLAPRVASQLIPEIAVAHAENWGRIDPKKRLYIERALQDFYRLNGRTAEANAIARNWTSKFPETRLLEEGRHSMSAGRFDNAALKFEDVIAYNPMFSPAYRQLGSCMLSLGQIDSAINLLETANGLNPANPAILNELGVAYAQSGRLDEAERCWRNILRIERYDAEAMLNLLRLYSTHGRLSDYEAALMELADWPTIPPTALRWLGDYYQSVGQPARAEYFYRQALPPDSDSAPR
jgi:Flp pilus assembly protein TadD